METQFLCKLCQICQEPIDDSKSSVRVGEKGCQGIRAACENHSVKVIINPGDYVHVLCRKNFTRTLSDKHSDDKYLDRNDKHLRSVAPNFDFKSRCLFCGTFAKCGKLNKKRSFDAYPVRSLEFQSTIIKKCIDRDDQWAHDIKLRLSHVFDLPAADAVYHQQCNVNFRTGKSIPKAYQTGNCDNAALRSPGRPEQKEQKDAFEKVMLFLEGATNETLTVSDLVSEMTNVCGEKAYSTKHMKKKIIEHFGNEVIISSIDGKNDIVSLKSNASAIIHSFYEDLQGQSDEEKKKNFRNCWKIA
jgi:hypothetical protein